MKPILARKLIEANAIRAGSEVEILLRSDGVREPGIFLVAGAKSAEDEVIFVLVDARGSRRRVPSTAIAAIDGMDPARLAVIHNLSVEGAAIPVGKRRGRKPKQRYGASGRVLWSEQPHG